MLDSIQVDAHYMGRLINSLENIDEQLRIGAVFCIYPYFSLFIHESRAQLKRLSPADYANVTLNADASEMVAKSRHSLKLFEDNKRGIIGQLEYFESIDKAHKQYFIDSVRLPWAERWKTDLSVVYYDNKIISTSHSTTFTLGLELSDLFGPGMGQKLFSISKQYGEYVSAWGITKNNADSFATHMINSKYNPRDTRSMNFYQNIFNGKSTPGYNALLTTFQALINSCNSVISLDASFESKQTIFKIKYLTIYQVIRSLSILKLEKFNTLTKHSLECIDELITHPTALMILDSSKKPFRNTLMHYNISPRIDSTSLSLKRPLYGLSDTVFGIKYEMLDEKITELIKDSAVNLNQWSSS